MIGNWRITAHLSSPLCGEAPRLDALLTWQMAMVLGKKCKRKITRSTPLKDVVSLKIPIVSTAIDGDKVLCCSDPIIDISANKWQERIAGRFDVSSNSLMLAPEKRKAIQNSSGPLKQRFSPVNICSTGTIVWFARCDKKQVNSLLKRVYALGKLRKIGYGAIALFSYDKQEEDISIFAEKEGERILMRTVPLKLAIGSGCAGYRSSYGACQMPYWHSENYTEVAIPC